MTTSPNYLSIAFLVAAAAFACSAEDGSTSESSQDAASATTEAAIRFANSANHNDPVDLVDDTTWQSTEGGSSEGAMVRVLLTDAPTDAEHVNVSVCAVDVEDKAAQQSGSDNKTAWHRVANQCNKVDLRSLQNGETEALALGNLPQGDYGRIRLMIRDCTITKDGETKELALSQEGLKNGFMVENQFSVRKGEAATITVEFNAGNSVQKANSGYELRPSLSVKALQTRTRERQCDGASDGNCDGVEHQGENAGGAGNQGSCQGSCGGPGAAPEDAPSQGENAGGAGNQGETGAVNAGPSTAAGTGADSAPNGSTAEKAAMAGKA